MNITWWGHATVAVADRGTTILTDPVLRNRLAHLHRRRGPRPVLAAAPDAVVISHLHGDHCDVPSLRALPLDPHRRAPRRRRVPALPARRRPYIIEIAAGESVDVGELHVRAVPRQPRRRPQAEVPRPRRRPRLRDRRHPLGLVRRRHRTLRRDGGLGQWIWRWCRCGAGAGRSEPAISTRRARPRRCASSTRAGRPDPLGHPVAGRLQRGPARPVPPPRRRVRRPERRRRPRTDVRVLAPGDSLTVDCVTTFAACSRRSPGSSPSSPSARPCRSCRPAPRSARPRSWPRTAARSRCSPSWPPGPPGRTAATPPRTPSAAPAARRSPAGCGSCASRCSSPRRCSGS